MTEVAEKIINKQSENSLCQAQQIDEDGNTALIYACNNNMISVSQKILKLNCRPEHIRAFSL